MADTSNLWTFADALHPVYTRPPQVTAWTFGDKRFKPQRYESLLTGGAPVSGEYPVAEKLEMPMIGHPSVTVYQDAGTRYTYQDVEMKTNYSNVDLRPIQALGASWIGYLKAMSQGPYSGSELRKLGNPYGYGPPPGDERAATLSAWDRFGKPRKLPPQKRHFKGLRGSVANRDIVNMGSGNFLAGWRWDMIPSASGVRLSFWNEALTRSGKPYPWFIFHGTIYMQSHGPWGAVAQRMIGPLMDAWRQTCYQAYRETVRRAQAMAMQVSIADTIDDAGGSLIWEMV